MSPEAAALLVGIFFPIIVFTIGTVIAVALLSAAIRHPIVIIGAIVALVYYAAKLEIIYDDRHGDWPPATTQPYK